MSGWIEYYEDRSVEIPEGQFIEFETTFFGNTRQQQVFVDTGIPEIRIIFNRAAPSCVSRFRIIPEINYQKSKLNFITKRLAQLDKDKEQCLKDLSKVEERIKELE